MDELDKVIKLAEAKNRKPKGFDKGKRSPFFDNYGMDKDKAEEALQDWMGMSKSEKFAEAKRLLWESNLDASKMTREDDIKNGRELSEVPLPVAKSAPRPAGQPKPQPKPQQAAAPPEASPDEKVRINAASSVPVSDLFSPGSPEGVAEWEKAQLEDFRARRIEDAKNNRERRRHEALGRDDDDDETKDEKRKGPSPEELRDKAMFAEPEDMAVPPEGMSAVTLDGRPWYQVDPIIDGPEVAQASYREAMIRHGHSPELAEFGSNLMVDSYRAFEGYGAEVGSKALETLRRESVRYEDGAIMGLYKEGMTNLVKDKAKFTQ
jgi:hypothetical protein